VQRPSGHQHENEGFTLNAVWLTSVPTGLYACKQLNECEITQILQTIKVINVVVSYEMTECWCTESCGDVRRSKAD